MLVRLATALVAVALLVCCGNHQDDARASESIASLNTPPLRLTQFAVQHETLLHECALFNGIEFNPELIVEPASSAEPIIYTRDHMLEFGSGIAQSLANGPQPQPTPQVRPSAEEIRIMTEGPIRVPPNGSEFEDGGCYQWADSEIEQISEYRTFVALQERYHGMVNEFKTESPALQDINRRWSVCMASSGYPGLERPGDQLDLIMDRAREAAGSEDTSAVLEFDIAISVANWDCYQPLGDEIDDVWDEGFADFLDASDVEFLQTLDS